MASAAIEADLEEWDDSGGYGSGMGPGGERENSNSNKGSNSNIGGNNNSKSNGNSNLLPRNGARQPHVSVDALVNNVSSCIVSIVGTGPKPMSLLPHLALGAQGTGYVGAVHASHRPGYPLWVLISGS